MENGACSYRRFLAGDENGLVEIIRDYKDGLMLYINSYVQNIHVAEDLTEDTFVRLMVRRPHFAGKSRFKTWLYAIGRHLAVDYLRRASRVMSLSEEEAACLADGEEDIARTYIRDERRLLVHRALNRLAPDYRCVLYLVFFEDMSNAEAAAVMGKSRRQVENLLYRAKGALKKELEKEGFVYEEF